MTALVAAERRVDLDPSKGQDGPILWCAACAAEFTPRSARNVWDALYDHAFRVGSLADAIDFRDRARAARP